MRYIAEVRDSKCRKLAGASAFLFFAAKGLLWMLAGVLGTRWIGGLFS